MPRKPRKKSITGIYHIVLRGINKQNIFEEDYDYSKFINTIQKYKQKYEYHICAYCLMSNHIHILIKVERDNLFMIMKSITISYAYWFNLKYTRCGHLFQDRYKSETVEDDRRFIVVINYIHNNPVKAALCERADDYKHSSKNDMKNKNNTILDITYIGSIIDIESLTDMDSLTSFDDDENNGKQPIDDHAKIRINDNEAKSIINNIQKNMSFQNPRGYYDFTNEQRTKFIHELRKKYLSVKQINRLTGISIGLIRNNETTLNRLNKRESKQIS